MTHDEKHQWFHKGWYVVPVPGTCTAYWTSADWIRYIDINEGWAKSKGD